MKEMTKLRKSFSTDNDASSVVQLRPLKLEEDFYALSWLGHIKENKANYSITYIDQWNNFKGCAIIFLI